MGASGLQYRLAAEGDIRFGEGGVLLFRRVEDVVDPESQAIDQHHQLVLSAANGRGQIERLFNRLPLALASGELVPAHAIAHFRIDHRARRHKSTRSRLLLGEPLGVGALAATSPAGHKNQFAHPG